MGIRKFRGLDLFDGHRLRGPGQVLLTDDSGRVSAIQPAAEAGDNVELLDGIISPGFVNCHCHLELSHLRGKIGRGGGIVPFVSGVMSGRFAADEYIQAAIREAGQEMIRNGIVAVGDICNTADSIPQKRSGTMRYHNFIEVSGFDPKLAQTRFEKALALAGQFEQLSPQVSIVPHAPYSVSEPLWQLITGHNKNYLYSIHNQEDPAENEFFLEKTGAFTGLFTEMKLDISFFEPSKRSSLSTYVDRFPADKPVILVHNVFTSRTDLDYINGLSDHPEIYWCLCPNANRYITGQLPDIRLLMQDNRKLVLGTDSLASNDSLDLLSEIRVIRAAFPEISLEQMLVWATSNGAEALQMQDSLGSFEEGKKPGLVLIDAGLDQVKRIL